MPIVFEGLVEISNRRPEKPVEYLAKYLLEHNPERTEV